MWFGFGFPCCCLIRRPNDALVLIISLQVCNYIPRVIIIMREKLVSLDEELPLAGGTGEWEWKRRVGESLNLILMMLN